MHLPTRGQLRAILLLAIIIAAATVAALLIPQRTGQQPDDDNTRLAALVADYTDSLTPTPQANRQAGNYHPTKTKRAHRPDSTKRYKIHHPEQSAPHNPQHFTPHADRKHNYPVIELNSADTIELQLLRSVGPTFAQRIARYRDRLGGFVRSDQLFEVYGMTADRFNQFASQLSIDTSKVHKININSATVDQLRKHPYLDYYQAKSIVLARQRGVRFNTMSDLLLVNTIDTVTITKLQGYIQFN